MTDADVTTPPRPLIARLELAALSAVVLPFLVWTSFGIGGPVTTERFIDVTAALCVGAAYVASVRTAMRATRRVKVAWMLISLGLLFGVVGRVVSLVAVAPPADGVWRFSGVDVAYLGAYGMLVLGVVLLGASGQRTASRLRPCLDALIACSSLFVVAWTTLLADAWNTLGPMTLDRVVMVVYPVSDIFLLGVMGYVVVRARDPHRGPIIVLAAGAGVLALTDCLFIALHIHGLPTQAHPVRVGTVLASLLLVIAARRWPTTADVEPSDEVIGWTTSALPYPPVIAGMVTAGLRMLTTGAMDGPTVAGGLMAVVLVMVRQSLLMSDRMALESRLRWHATHDPLTKLPNRSVFSDRLAGLLERYEAGTAAPPAIVFIDVDDFKTVNDTLGHHGGDQALAIVAERIRRAIRAQDLVARLGGDEFAVLLVDEANRDPLAACRRILASVREPIVIEGRLAPLGVSGGLAVPRRGESAREVLARADAAMYAAKARGKGRIELFDSGDELLERRGLRNELRAGIREGQLRLVYQPIATAAGDVVGYEALVRWAHPQLGMLAPDRFIPVAEETGAIIELGRWVLEQACSDAVRTLGADGDRWVSVNVSAHQLRDASFLKDLAEVLDRTGLAPDRLYLEVTETALSVDAVIERCLEGVRALGVKLAIDDFGTGYSSLKALIRLRTDMLKVAGAVVDEAAEMRGRAVMIAIVQIAETFGLTVVAEGIETREQLERVRQLGSDYVQGFMIGRPLPLEQLTLPFASLSPA